MTLFAYKNAHLLLKTSSKVVVLVIYVPSLRTFIAHDARPLMDLDAAQDIH